ncbi:hypothetical protein BGW41_006945 [Actinomortierella wolfii]|nr:hypothetical protein BGW41_006945 [Actinomortierella wolfii]
MPPTASTTPAIYTPSTAARIPASQWTSTPPMVEGTHHRRIRNVVATEGIEGRDGTAMEADSITEQQQQHQLLLPQDAEEEMVEEEEQEPDGPRMTRLRGILAKSLQETLKVCNTKAIQECFPQLAQQKPQDLLEAHAKVCEFLQVEVNNEFEQIIKERNVAYKLNALDRLVAEAKSQGRTAGSTALLDLTPEAAVRARVVPAKEAEVQRLKEELERVRLDNRRLGGALNHCAAEQEALKFELDELFQEFQQSYGIASQLPVAEMQQLLDATLAEIRDP